MAIRDTYQRIRKLNAAALCLSLAVGFVGVVSVVAWRSRTLGFVCLAFFVLAWVLVIVDQTLMGFGRGRLMMTRRDMVEVIVIAAASLALAAGSVLAVLAVIFAR